MSTFTYNYIYDRFYCCYKQIASILYSIAMLSTKYMMIMVLIGTL